MVGALNSIFDTPEVGVTPFHAMSPCLTRTVLVVFPPSYPPLFSEFFSPFPFVMVFFFLRNFLAFNETQGLPRCSRGSLFT